VFPLPEKTKCAKSAVACPPMIYPKLVCLWTKIQTTDQKDWKLTTPVEQLAPVVELKPEVEVQPAGKLVV